MGAMALASDAAAVTSTMEREWPAPAGLLLLLLFGLAIVPGGAVVVVVVELTALCCAACSLLLRRRGCGHTHHSRTDSRFPPALLSSGQLEIFLSSSFVFFIVHTLSPYLKSLSLTSNQAKALHLHHRGTAGHRFSGSTRGA